MEEADQLFRVLADPSRRRLLDMLHGRSGLTLNELCRELDMRRQSASQHLTLLTAANLVNSLRDGRYKLLPQPGTHPRDSSPLDLEIRGAAAHRAPQHQAESGGTHDDSSSSRTRSGWRSAWATLVASHAVILSWSLIVATRNPRWARIWLRWYPIVLPDPAIPRPATAAPRCIWPPVCRSG